MLLALVFILLLIGAAVVGSLYSNFIVFYKSFSEIDSYNKAYYASIAALERGELVTKQREPGYVGSGGWEGNSYTSSIDNTDKIESGFSYLVKSDDTNLLRDVNSRTKRVPKEGEGDVDRMLATGDSLNYNKMDYEDAEVFLLYIDNLQDSPYTKKSCLKNNDDCMDVKVTIGGKIRLPGKIRPVFSDLNTSSGLVIGGNKNDEIVDWQLRGTYNNSQFTIFARNKAVVSGGNQEMDSVIRESHINEGVDLSFGNSEKDRQPNIKNPHNSTLISISSETLDSHNFKEILYPTYNSNYSRLNLRLSLLNLLKSTKNMIYPYLEYYLEFSSEVSDKYFKIDGEGRYKDYQVNIIMHKPTVKESVLGNFTVIF